MKDADKLQVWKSFFDDAWQWSCAVCNYGDNIPWFEAGSWSEAMAAVEAHIRQHLRVGQRLEWAPVA